MARPYDEPAPSSASARKVNARARVQGIAGRAKNQEVVLENLFLVSGVKRRVQKIALLGRKPSDCRQAHRCGAGLNFNNHKDLVT